DESIATVMERVSGAYVTMLERNFHRLLDGTASRKPQDHARATYTAKLLPSDCQIDWTRGSDDIYNLIRAYSAPYPGAYTHLDNKILRVWASRHPDRDERYVGRVPGRVIRVQPGEGAIVLTGDGALMLTEVQFDSADRVSADVVLKTVSMTLGNPELGHNTD
ncbi:MAG: hypothetical protein RLN70_08340, partial [Rhodospirillaceae bacterium]